MASGIQIMIVFDEHNFYHRRYNKQIQQLAESLLYRLCFYVCVVTTHPWHGNYYSLNRTSLHEYSLCKCQCENNQNKWYMKIHFSSQVDAFASDVRRKLAAKFDSQHFCS